MDQRLTRSMIDERRTITRSRNPIGSVSPLNSHPKTSRRSVSPLPINEKARKRSVSPLPINEKARKGSVSPFRGFVSPYSTQPKTPPSSVSPLKTPRKQVSALQGSASPLKTPRKQVSSLQGSVSSLHNQDKTPRGSVSPYNSQQKTPRGSVSPFRGSASPFRGNISPYRNQEKTLRAQVSPSRNQEKVSIGSVSPLHNHPKTHSRSVSPLQSQPKTPSSSISPSRNQVKTPRAHVFPLENQPKTPRSSISPSRNQVKTPRANVSPIQNQPKTPRSSISPSRNQVKTPRANVSPIHNQPKAPKAYVSPITDEEITPADSPSLHNNKKDNISDVSPSQVQKNLNGGFVSPLPNPENPNKSSISPLQNEENPNRDSGFPTQNQEKTTPNYLKASSSTCHDICKYGSRNNSEDEKAKTVLPKRKKKIIKLRSLSSGKIVFSEQIELISVDSSNSNEVRRETVEWRDIVSYDALVPLKEGKMEEIEFEDVSKNPKLVDKKNRKTIIRIKDLFSKTEEIESKNTNLDDLKNPDQVEGRNKKQNLRLQETNERDNVGKERNVVSTRTNMDWNKKLFNRKDVKEMASSKSKSDENSTNVTNKSKPIGKPTTQKQSAIDVNKLSKEKTDKYSKSMESESENAKSVENNKKDMIKKDKETYSIAKEKNDASSRSKVDSNKKSYNVKDNKDATTSKSKAINEESGEKFVTILDKFKSKEKNNKTDMHKLSKDKHSPRKKSIFSITRSSSGRRSHEGKIEKIVIRSKKGLNAPSTSSFEPKERTLHMVEPKSHKASPNSRNSKPKEEQEIPLKPEKSKFRRGKVVELPSDANSPRKLRFRNKRGSNENLSGFQIGRRSFRRKGSIGSGSSNSNGQIVMLKHRGTQEKKGLQGLFNSIIEETVNKLVKTRKSKVKALVGAFETVISLQDEKSVPLD